MENNTGNMLYATRDFSVDRATGAWDVEDWDANKKEMKPWEVRNALAAEDRRNFVLTWLKAASGWQEKMIRHCLLHQNGSRRRDEIIQAVHHRET